MTPLQQSLDAVILFISYSLLLFPVLSILPSLSRSDFFNLSSSASVLLRCDRTLFKLPASLSSTILTTLVIWLTYSTNLIGFMNLVAVLFLYRVLIVAVGFSVGAWGMLSHMP
jgi:nitrate reductase NapE component